MGAVLAMKPIAFIAALAFLIGCQSGVQRLTGAAPPTQMTLPAEALTGPVMRIKIPSRGANAALSRVAVNKDVETWLSTDNISVSFRRGVLVATRGLGFDLMAADAQNSLDAMTGHGPEVYRRQMRYLTGENQSTYLTAACSMVIVGSETVGGKRLQRLDVDCKARRHLFTDQFWRDGSGMVVKSRQWVSPQVGYLTSNLIQR